MEGILRSTAFIFQFLLNSQWRNYLNRYECLSDNTSYQLWNHINHLDNMGLIQQFYLAMFLFYVTWNNVMAGFLCPVLGRHECILPPSTPSALCSSFSSQLLVFPLDLHQPWDFAPSWSKQESATGMAWGKRECEWSRQVVTIPDLILFWKQSYYLDSRIQVGFCYVTCSAMNYCQLVRHVTVAGTGVCPNLMILFYFVCMLQNLIFPFVLYTVKLA